MVPELEKATVTELLVRMDCNGCVQKVKRAMHRIEGVYDVSIDFPQQKLTVVGRADPEMIVKVIKKTSGKIATICSHQDPTSAPSEEQPPAPEAAQAGSEPTAAPEAASEVPQAPPTQEEPPKDVPPPPAVEPSQDAKDAADPDDKLDMKDVGMVHYYPHGYIHWNHYPSGGHDARYETSPYYITHNYNSYRSPPSHAYEDGHIRYIGSEAYGITDGYHRSSFSAGNSNNITSVFSDENPNACTIV